MAKIDAFFNLMFEQKASDLHMTSGNPPMLRINGEMERVDYPPLENDSLKTMLYEISPDYKIKQFEELGDVDFGYEIPNISRFRVNFFSEKNGVAAVFRQIPSRVLSFEDFEKLEAPLPSVLKKFTMLNRGLVVVTGPTGSGKSTTLAAMMDYANKNRKDHIITLEDPIEFVHDQQKLPGEPSGSRRSHQIICGGIARRVARRPGHHSRRRNARLGNHRTGHHRRRHRPPGFRHVAHAKRLQNRGPHH